MFPTVLPFGSWGGGASWSGMFPRPHLGHCWMPHMAWPGSCHTCVHLYWSLPSTSPAQHPDSYDVWGIMWEYEGWPKHSNLTSCLSFSPLNTKGAFFLHSALCCVDFTFQAGKKNLQKGYNQQGNCQFWTNKSCLVFISCQCSSVHKDSLSILLWPRSENSVAYPGQETCLTHLGFETILT